MHAANSENIASRVMKASTTATIGGTIDQIPR